MLWLNADFDCSWSLCCLYTEYTVCTSLALIAARLISSGKLSSPMPVRVHTSVCSVLAATTDMRVLCATAISAVAEPGYLFLLPATAMMLLVPVRVVPTAHTMMCVSLLYGTAKPSCSTAQTRPGRRRVSVTIFPMYVSWCVSETIFATDVPGDRVPSCRAGASEWIWDQFVHSEEPTHMLFLLAHIQNDDVQRKPRKLPLVVCLPASFAWYQTLLLW